MNMSLDFGHLELSPAPYCISSLKMANERPRGHICQTTEVVAMLLLRLNFYEGDSL